MSVRHLAALSVLVAACRIPAPDVSAADAGPRLVAFECTRRIEGKRTTGVQRLRFRPALTSAVVTLDFEADGPCSYSATWRFPQSFPNYVAATHDKTRGCLPSSLSSFAVSCELMRHDLHYVTQALRTELLVHASGPSVQRSIAFSTPWRSDPVTPVPSSSCQGLPVRSPEAAGDPAFVSTEGAEGLEFDESSCHVIP